MVISGPGGVALAFLVDDFVPWGGDARERRTTSGAVDLARSLGLVLEAATPEHLPARAEVRAGLVRPQPGAGRAPAAARSV